MFKKCVHNSYNRYVDGKFCPDCGKEIKIIYKLIKCSDCKELRTAKFEKNKILPLNRFCTKCGARGWFIQTKEKATELEAFFSIETKTASTEKIKFDVICEDYYLRSCLKK